MENDVIVRKFASMIGTTAVITAGTVGLLSTGSYSLPNYTHQLSFQFDISTFKLTNPYEVRISLQSEEIASQLDPPIPIPVVNKMVFRYGFPEQKTFSM